MAIRLIGFCCPTVPLLTHILFHILFQKFGLKYLKRAGSRPFHLGVLLVQVCFDLLNFYTPLVSKNTLNPHGPTEIFSNNTHHLNDPVDGVLQTARLGLTLTVFFANDRIVRIWDRLLQTGRLGLTNAHLFLLHMIRFIRTGPS